MKKIIFSFTCCAALFAGVNAQAAITSSTRTESFKASMVYDDPNQANTVDKSAKYDEGKSSGVGRNEDLVVGCADFTALLVRAANAGYGGTLYFNDAEVLSSSASMAFNASFGSKRLRIDSSASIYTDAYNLRCTPVSGEDSIYGCGFLGVDGDFEFSFKENGLKSGEHIRAVAGTILGSDNGFGSGRWSLQATLDNGDVIAASSTVDIHNGNATDDTFFGLYAPAGRFITKVYWRGGNAPAGLDCLAFITNPKDIKISKTVVPKVIEEEVPQIANSGTNSTSSASSSGSDGRSLFGIDVLSGDDEEESTEEEATDYSALFGSDQAGGSRSSSNSTTGSSSGAE